MESRRSTHPDPEPKYYRVSEVAKLLNVSRDKVYRAVHNGELPHNVVLGMIRIPVSAVKLVELGEDN